MKKSIVKNFLILFHLDTGMIIFSDMMNLFGKYWKPSDQIKKEIITVGNILGKDGILDSL